MGPREPGCGRQIYYRVDMEVCQLVMKAVISTVVPTGHGGCCLEHGIQPKLSMPNLPLAKDSTTRPCVSTFDRWPHGVLGLLESPAEISSCSPRRDLNGCSRLKISVCKAVTMKSVTFEGSLPLVNTTFKKSRKQFVASPRFMHEGVVCCCL